MAGERWPNPPVRPVIDTIMDFARSNISDEGLRFFSEKAFWLADESQKATAIPALTLIASLSLLFLLLWVAAIAGVARFALRTAHNARIR